MKKVMMYVLIGVTILIVSGVAFLFLTGGKDAQAGANASPSPHAEAKKEKETIPLEIESPFVANIKNSTKYVKLKLTLEIKDEKAKAHVEGNEYKLRDRILYILRNKGESELLSPEAQVHLKEDILKEIQENLKMEEIVGLYIGEFVIQ